MIVRIDAFWRSKSATATLSDGSKVPLTLTKNELEPGDTEHTLEYGAESGPQDSPIAELNCAAGTSCPILWTQPSSYALSPKVRVSIKLRPEEKARRRIARLPKFIQDYLYEYGGGNLEDLAEYGESLVKAGTTKADLAPIEVQGKAPPDPEFEFVQAARKGRYSQFSSFGEFKKDLSRKVAAAKEQARTTGLTPPDPFEGAEWHDDPAAAQEKWDKFVFGEYDKALKAEAPGLRHVGEVASMAQNAWLQALGISAALGTGGAGLEAFGGWLSLPTLLESSTGISSATWLSRFAMFGLGTSYGMNLINQSREAIAAGSDPVAVPIVALEDTFGGKVVEKIRNKSNLTGEELNLGTEERVTGGILDFLDGVMNVLGASEAVKTPGAPIPRRPPAEPISPGHDTPTLPAADRVVPPAVATEAPHATASPQNAPAATTTATGQPAPTTVPAGASRRISPVDRGRGARPFYAKDPKARSTAGKQLPPAREVPGSSTRDSGPGTQHHDQPAKATAGAGKPAEPPQGGEAVRTPGEEGAFKEGGRRRHVQRRPQSQREDIGRGGTRRRPRLETYLDHRGAAIRGREDDDRRQSIGRV
jgi:hypothetical protein